jgi:hypothetical protein
MTENAAPEPCDAIESDVEMLPLIVIDPDTDSGPAESVVSVAAVPS